MTNIPAVDPATGKAPISDPAGGTGAVTFTAEQQKAIDAITGSIRKEAKSTGASEATANLLKELGAENTDALKSMLADYKKAQDAQKTEQQKQADQLAVLTKERDDALAKADKAKTVATEKLLRAAVLTEVNTANIDPAEHESVWLLIKNDAALRDAIKPKGDDGFEGVDAVVKKIAEAHPRWLKSEAQGDGVGTGKPASRKTKADPDVEKRIQEQSRKTYQRTW